MPNPTAAMLVIGDEILSGRTRDANMHHLAGQLTEAGIDLQEVRVVSDDADAIVAAVQALAGAYAHVFTSGGIGPTHDDITADCIAVSCRPLRAAHRCCRGPCGWKKAKAIWPDHWQISRCNTLISRSDPTPIKKTGCTDRTWSYAAKTQCSSMMQ